MMYDPVKAWRELTDAFADGDHETVRARAFALVEWIGKGGWNPINCSHSGAVALLSWIVEKV